MARTIAEIKKSITDVLIADPAIIYAYQLDPDKTFEEEFSPASVESILLYTIANGIHVHEKLFDEHKAEVTDYIANMKPHSLKWYANKAKAYQHGHVLPVDSDIYDNSLLTDELIENSRVVKYAAVTEQERGLRIKVATNDGDDLDALSPSQLAGFSEYMSRIKDAGVKLLITSNVADALKLTVFVKYDALVLDNQGRRLDGVNSEPVQQAIRLYLKNLPFNGKLELSAMVDEIQKVDGVKAPYIIEASAKYGALDYGGFIDQSYTPDSGYLRFLNEEEDMNIQFEPEQ